MSSVHKKLMQARIKLQGMSLKKSGKNKFAGFEYFELGDFLPQIQQIFEDIGLCGVISFDTQLATLTITDIDGDSNIVLTSPIAEANLKGVHPIQNLGAVQTYLRRYLWVAALEIVEHDALDSSPGKSTSMDVGTLADCLAAIDASSSLPELQKSFTEAIKASKDDQAAQAKIIAAKDAKKASLK